MRLSELTLAFLSLLTLSACQAVIPEAGHGEGPTQTVQAVRQTPASAAPVPAKPDPGPKTFVFSGELEQGGWIRGKVPVDTKAARFGDTELEIDGGWFFAGIDRDARRSATLVAELANGMRVRTPVSISPRDWDIERVDVALRPGGMSESFWRIREPELKQIHAARRRDERSDGWTQDFIWPVLGRISGRFGSQRIYRGEPGSYHTGLDIAPGAGAPFVSPADGVVTLAAREPFSLEGHLIIVDHGRGLNSAFLHAATIAVQEGQGVRQGERLGTVGASGRATGPHLHWSLKWRDARLDPLLFLE